MFVFINSMCKSKNFFYMLGKKMQELKKKIVLLAIILKIVI